jgi:SAM-dependent methyltransferase
MSRPARVEHGVERLDQPILDGPGHEASLGHLRGINRWLGGTRAVRGALAPLVRPGARIALVDVGCGAADVPIELSRWAARLGAQLSVLAIDRAVAAAAVARRRTGAVPGMHVACADAFALPLADEAVDAALMTLTLHHFDRDGRTRVLAEMARVARRLVVINDLERSWPNYLGARLLAVTLWRANRYTRHDAPLSVLRAFAPAELLADLVAAGLGQARVHRRFFCRLIGTAEPRGGP